MCLYLDTPSLFFGAPPLEAEGGGCSPVRRWLATLDHTAVTTACDLSEVGFSIAPMISRSPFDLLSFRPFDKLRDRVVS